jgi:ATP-dependent protease ClpP protease subunit
MTPLFDQEGRTLALGTGASIGEVVDGLLRFHAAKGFKKPITFYVVGGAEAAPGLTATEAMMLVGVMRTLRSPIRTVGLGWLRGWQPVVLAGGTPGQRFLIEHTLLSVAPLEWADHAKPHIGWQPTRQEQLKHQTERLLQEQIHHLLGRLQLDPASFASDRVLNPVEAIDARFADHVVDQILTPEPSLTIPSREHEAQP